MTSAIAALARSAHAPFDMEVVELEEPRAGEVLVRIVGVGICHTDLAFKAMAEAHASPTILGHEGSGIVAQVGPGVSKVAPGDHVVLTFNSCGTCPRCTSGEPAYCHSFPQLNFSGARPDGSSAICLGKEQARGHFFGQSSFANYAIAMERNVVRVASDFPLSLLGPLGCGVQTGAGAVFRSLNCQPGSALVVLGGGAVGLSAVMAAVIRGCNPIIVVEPKGERRDLALELGATHAIDPTGVDILAAVREIIPQGVNNVIDTSGIIAAVEAAMLMLAPRGTLGLVGLPSPIDGTANLPMAAVIGAGVQIRGIMEGDSEPDQFIPELLELYRRGRFPFDRLVTTYRFDEINQAVLDQSAGKCVKPVLIMH